MKNKTIVIVITIILGIFIGIGIFFITDKKEKTIFIPEVTFTLNDIKNRFLASPYAIDNKCKGSIKDNTIIIKCNKKYTFSLENTKLVLDISSSKDTEIFKYMVDAIETFYGSDYTDYYETLDKFLSKELSINNLYFIETDKIQLKVDLLNILDKYISKDTITTETVKDKFDVDYEYSELNYKIGNIELIYNNDLNWLTFGGTLFGNDQDVFFILKLYDNNNVLLYEHKEDLNNFNNQNFAYCNFGINIDLNKLTFNYNNIKSYSISLKK